MKKPDFHAEFVEACMLASGYANMCGYHAAARQIAEIAICDKNALTTAVNRDTIKTAARQGEEEEKTMKNYKITFRFDGHMFFDVVNAETAEKAFEYLGWIEDYTGCFDFISAEETTEFASYFCPQGWTKPESRKAAQIRSLEMALDAAGIPDNPVYTPELDEIMKKMGFDAKKENGVDIFGDIDPETFCIRYTKHDSAAVLIVPIKKEDEQ